MMKLLSVAIPCYNSAAYMRHCIETLLPGGEEIEILVVDDGSQKDNTLEIAKEYAEKYPTIVRAIHQENAGHGGAVNRGLENATGKYFKVVDSDDWVDSDVLMRILTVLRRFSGQGEEMLDLLISNYVYDKVGAEHKKVMRYAPAIPTEQVLTWPDVHRLPVGKYILMHSVIYRTALLREMNLRLPEHTFYVDNLYVYAPMEHVQRMYYLDADFYHYFIGRDDQSVQESIMIKRIDQQLRVNKLMVDMVRLERLENRHQRQYMFAYLSIITMISNVLLLLMDTEEAAQKRKALWQHIAQTDPWIYQKLERSAVGRLAHVRTRFGRWIVVHGYGIAQKVIGFN